MVINHSKLIGHIVLYKDYAIGYIKYGGTRIYAEIGTHREVWDSIDKKQTFYLSKYSFYEQNTDNS